MLRPILYIGVVIVAAVVFAGLMATVTVSMRGGGDAVAEREPVPVLYALPDFELTSQAGEAVRLGDLRGKVWVASFVFTRCMGICPVMTGVTSELQRQLQAHQQWDDIRLVSVSVDPEHDTPRVLREYGERFEADFDHWLFLTGERKPIWRLIEDGFRLAVADTPENPEMPIMHSDKFVLVDREGRIRGYYSSLDQADRDQLVNDLHAVLAEPWPADPGSVARHSP